ncbi:EscU/YscU/HrcU family type III secretion system export apparatus switch protein [Desulforamulus aquiferis]|uniref:EscU/YscU/HrcU family type III secretion system export apparatus switch protein n=2 Tax=Desulforamulus aquiferis TaxID=1397668 RepID=A0AAW7ZJZ3_9FIRM|nr:EscU/YscU/HrcU family type III secretion system export apparatus switch protein [Desulforamulus aquiferis]MDO7789190.1 EscU/YscU/HrcU family type III secretion system export apparatus switch protein [Desulforamulus aquiferis]
MTTRKPRVAAALRYRSQQDNAPIVVAAGKGDLAEAIEKLAKENNIPLYKDQHLAKTLTELGLGVEIPQELYQAVALILAHVANLDTKKNP